LHSRPQEPNPSRLAFAGRAGAAAPRAAAGAAPLAAAAPARRGMAADCGGGSSGPSSSATVVLVKQHADPRRTGHHAHGGRHVFACLAAALAACRGCGDGGAPQRAEPPLPQQPAPPAVHLVFSCSPARLLQAAAAEGWLAELAPAPCAVGAAWAWRGVRHAALFDPADIPAAVERIAAAAAPLTAPAAAAGAEAAEEKEGLAQAAAAAAPGWAAPPVVVVLDADKSQAARGGALPAALAAAAARSNGQLRLVLLVQNLHHLPFGPAGCAPRAAGARAAWRTAAGALCASAFVAGYMLDHGAREGALPPDWAARCCTEDGGGGDSGGGGGGGPEQRRRRPLRVLRLGAIGAFGPPPWPNRGATAAEELWPGGLGGGPARRPVVGMLKVSPEKGACVFAALARRMPDCNFLGVDCSSGDGGSSGGGGGGGGGSTGDGRDGEPPPTSSGGGHSGALPPNTRLMLPTGDLDALISAIDVLIAPSLLQEAFGMVVTDAALRGVPAVVAAAGGLPEAGGGGARLAPVRLASFPEACDACGRLVGAIAENSCGGSSAPLCGCSSGAGAPPGRHPSWEHRRLPSEQPAATWEAEVRALLAGPKAYASASATARRAALDAVGDAAAGGAEVADLLAWLLAVGRE
jgi:hypothetical protein